MIKTIAIFQLIVMAIIVPGIANGGEDIKDRSIVNLGRFTEKQLGKIIKTAADISDPGESIVFISGHFKGVNYEGSTLQGSENRKEILTINNRFLL